MIKKRKVREYNSTTKSGKATINKYDKTTTGKRKKVTKSYTGINNGEGYSISRSKNKKKSSGKEVNKTSRSAGVHYDGGKLTKTKSTTSKSGKVKSRAVTKTSGNYRGSKKVVKNGVEKKYVAWKNGIITINRKN